MPRDRPYRKRYGLSIYGPRRLDEIWAGGGRVHPHLVDRAAKRVRRDSSLLHEPAPIEHLVRKLGAGPPDLGRLESLEGFGDRRGDAINQLAGVPLFVLDARGRFGATQPNARSRGRGGVSIGDGIRQLISNQQPQFNAWFQGCPAYS